METTYRDASGRLHTLTPGRAHGITRATKKYPSGGKVTVRWNYETQEYVCGHLGKPGPLTGGQSLDEIVQVFTEHGWTMNVIEPEKR